MQQAIQTEMYLGPMPVRDVALEDLSVVERLPDVTTAIHRCVYSSGYTAADAADTVKMKAPQMSKILAKVAHFPHDRLAQFMLAMKNLAPLQKLAEQCGCVVIAKADYKKLHARGLL